MERVKNSKKKDNKGAKIKRPIKISDKNFKKNINRAVRHVIIKDLRNRIRELENVCYELYQVIGTLSEAHGNIFEDPQVQNAMDNASQAKMVHKDLLPFTLPVRHPLED